MKPRTISTVPLIVLVAIVALLVGSLGTATAAGLTSKKVKKIAAKVVNHKAPGLTVGNATNLAGKPASAYLDESRVFSTTITSAVGDVVVGLPLTAGTYYVSYHAYLYGGTGSSGCYLRRKQGTTALGYSADDVGTGANPGFSGSAVVSLAGSETLELYCFSTSSFTTLGPPAPDPIQVVVTPLDGVTTTVVAPSRPGNPAARERVH